MSRFAEKYRSQPGEAAAQYPAVQSAYDALMRSQRWFVGMLVACAMLGLTVLHGPRVLLGRRTFLPAIFATSLMALAYTLRGQLVLPSLAELRANPRDSGALRRWSRNTLIVQFLCSAVGLTGFALQLLGAPMFLALTLYVIAFAYLILLRPMRP